MSYNIMICRKPIPHNQAEAWAYIERLSEQDHDFGEKLPEDVMKLYTALTKEYPCICDLPDDEVDDGVWSDGPLKNNFSADFTCLGIVYSKVDEALPFIIKTANKMDFAVFDPQEEKIFS